MSEKVLQVHDILRAPTVVLYVIKDASLYYLGVALTRLKKLPDACKVFDEFKDVYGNSAPADLKARVAKARTEASCSA